VLDIGAINVRRNAQLCVKAHASKTQVLVSSVKTAIGGKRVTHLVVMDVNQSIVTNQTDIAHHVKKVTGGTNVIRVAYIPARHAFRMGIARNARKDIGATPAPPIANMDVHQTCATNLTEVVYVTAGTLANNANQCV